MLKLKTIEALKRKFEDVTDQPLEDWSAYDKLKDSSSEHVPHDLL